MRFAAQRPMRHKRAIGKNSALWRVPFLTHRKSYNAGVNKICGGKVRGMDIAIVTAGRKPVKGRITKLAPHEIAVEITNPYEGVSLGSRIPALVMAGLSRAGKQDCFYADANFAVTACGLGKARELLAEIAGACARFEECDRDAVGRECLACRREAFEKHAGGDYLDDSSFSAAKSDLKARLKTGSLSAGDYQSRLQALRVRRQRYRDILSEAENAKTEVLRRRAGVTNKRIALQLIKKYGLDGGG